MSRLKTDAIRNVNASVDGITLDTSGNVAIPNELQLADKIVHTGDTNTFIRFPAADVIAFETGGTERLRINSDGRIWVNTQTGSSATELLRVENTGSSSTNSRVSIVSGGAAQAVLLFGDDQSFDQGQIVYSNSDHSMRFHVNAGNERLRIDSSGRVMINTTVEGRATYGEALTIAGSGHCGMTIRSGTTSYGILHFSDGTSGADEYSGMVEYLQGTNRMRLFAGGKYNIVLNGGGSTEINHNEGKRIETTSTGAILTSGAAGTTSCRFGNTANRGLEVNVVNNGNNDAGVVLNAADSENSGYAAYIAFQTGGEEKGRFEGQYDNFRLSNTCSGITFNGDWAAANRLNDYEEGTWSQTATNLGDHTKHSDSHANYTKIGNLVTATFFYKWTGRSTNNGAYGVKVSMPFTAATLVIPGTGSCASESICLNNSDRTSFHTSIYSNTNLATFRASKHNDSEISFNGAISTSSSAGYFAGTLSYQVP